MKIAMFTNTYHPHVGGVARSVCTFEDELRRRGFEVSIVAPEFKGAEESDDHVFRVPAIQNFNGSDFSFRLPQPWVLSNHMDKIQPQLIHSHHPFLLGDSAVRTAYERQLPLVFTHHTMYEKYTHYVSLHSEGMKRFAIQMATEFCNLCHHVIAPSESIQKLLEQRGVKVPISTIPTGIDLDYFARGDRARFRRKFQIPQEATVIGHLGRLAAEKNLTYLANAVGSYLKDHPQAVFVVVGEGKDREEMERTLADLVPANQFVFTGRQVEQEVVDAYAGMDLFAFSSQSETQGMVIAEAMAAGKPVVALDGPGVREVVDEENGILLPGDATEAEFTQALTHLLGDSVRLAQFSENAQRSVKSYGHDACTDRLVEVYKTLIKEFEGKHDHDLTAWEILQGRLEAEWNLIAEKASAIAAAFAETNATKANLS